MNGIGYTREMGAEQTKMNEQIREQNLLESAAFFSDQEEDKFLLEFC